MKRVTAGLTVVVLLMGVWVAPPAQAAASLRIARVQPRSSTNAKEELVDIVNNSASAQDLSSWHLEYYSVAASTGVKPTRTIALHGSVAPGAHHVVASTNYLTDSADEWFAPVLADAGGLLKLVQSTSVIDHYAWGTAAGQVPTGPVASVASSTVPLQITELLPNPAAPQKDSVDEFVELYNPSSQSVALKGYKLQTGSNLTYSYNFDSETIDPVSYQAFYVPDTKLTLSNTAGKARLLGPSGETLSETPSYSAAAEGLSWVVDAGSWSWTTTPTPGVANIVTAVVDDSPAPVAKTTAPKAAAKKSISAVKGASAKTPKATASTEATSAAAKDDSTVPKQPVHASVLAGVGGLAVLYGIYEYRHDLANFYHKLRRNRKARSPDGESLEGR